MKVFDPILSLGVAAMPCPFPGINPYLEMQPFWSDFAPRLLAEMGNALLPQLLPRYDVRIEE